MPRTKSFYPPGFIPKRFVNISDATNARHAMKIAEFLDWKVTVEDIYVKQQTGNNLEHIKVGFKRATVRRGDPYSKNDLDVYAIVTHQYEVLPNEDCAYSIDRITDSFEAQYLFAREYSGGKTCISIEGNREWTEIPAKHWSLRVHIWNSHDTKRAFSGVFTIYDDKLGVYLLLGSESFRILHKAAGENESEHRQREFKGKIDLNVRKAIATMNERMNDLFEKSVMLASIDMSESELENLLRDLFVRSDNQSPSVVRKIEVKRADVLSIFKYDSGLDDYKGTAWAAYVAIVLHLDRKRTDSSEPRDYLNADWSSKDYAFELITDFAKKSGKLK
jgi:hypothetical protein